VLNPDAVLQVLERSDLSYDDLRRKLDVAPSELDVAIGTLLRSHQISRAGSRFRLHGALDPPAAQEDSTFPPPGMKRCIACEEMRRADDFYPHKHHSDGLSSRCRPCTRAAQRERDRTRRPVKSPTPTVSVADEPIATTAAPPPPRPTRTESRDPLMFVFFLDGAAIGRVVTGEHGIMAFEPAIDLTAHQLDELCRQWTERKAARS